MHAHDPKWEQRVLLSKEMPGFQWERWTDWQKGDARWDVKIIDTSENTVERTAGFVKNWIMEEKQKKQELTPENKWWI
jgi:hypothetical protein